MREGKALQKITERNPDGLRFLMNRYIPYVSSVAWGILKSSMTVEDAEEVVSDVFLALWQKPEGVQEHSVKAWLGAVARNKAKNKLRELGKELPLEEDFINFTDGETPLDFIERQEEQALVRQAVDSLLPKDREIFLRHYYYYQSVEEIGSALKMPANTVKSRLKRGREKIKEYILRRENHGT